MRISIFSDLHLEHYENPLPVVVADGVDVVILAGDIASGTEGISWAAKAFDRTKVKHVIYVPGNHEFYGFSRQVLLTQMRQKAAEAGVTFLDNDSVEVDNVRFLGTTLWSNFQLYGGGTTQALSMTKARNSISDYRAIRSCDGKSLTPHETLQVFEESITWLEAEMSKPFAGKTVVVSHFAPHENCVHPQYGGDALTPYFVNDLRAFMAKHKPDVWCYGHTHSNISFVDKDSGCRIVTNQGGYPHEYSDFKPDFEISV